MQRIMFDQRFAESLRIRDRKAMVKRISQKRVSERFEHQRLHEEAKRFLPEYGRNPQNEDREAAGSRDADQLNLAICKALEGGKKDMDTTNRHFGLRS